jgi:hypothetical protein
MTFSTGTPLDTFDRSRPLADGEPLPRTSAAWYRWARAAHLAQYPDVDPGTRANLDQFVADAERDEASAAQSRRNAVDAAPPDSLALDRIAAVLDGREWDADTLDAVAEAVRSTGRPVRDVDDDGGSPLGSV